MRYLKLCIDSKKTIENIDNLKYGFNNKLLSELIQLHLVLGDIEWQLDQLHDIVRKTIGNIEYEGDERL